MPPDLVQVNIEEAVYRQPPVDVGTELQGYSDKLINKVNEGNGGSPFRADYKDSKVLMYKELKVQGDIDIGEILAKDNDLDLAGAAEKE